MYATAMLCTLFIGGATQFPMSPPTRAQLSGFHCTWRSSDFFICRRSVAITNFRIFLRLVVKYASSKNGGIVSPLPLPPWYLYEPRRQSELLLIGSLMKCAHTLSHSCSDFVFGIRWFSFDVLKMVDYLVHHLYQGISVDRRCNCHSVASTDE